MKVKCVENKNIGYYLTIGETYDVIRINNFGDYLIINDIGNICSYSTKLFKTLLEMIKERNEKIDKLLGL